QSDRDALVRGDALSALAECRRGAELLVTTVFDRSSPYDLRTRAAELLAGVGGMAAGEAGRRGLVRGEEEAVALETAVPLFLELIHTLGVRHEAASESELLRLASHSPIPEARAEALLALGNYCSQNAREVLNASVRSKEREVELAARSA